MWTSILVTKSSFDSAFRDLEKQRHATFYRESDAEPSGRSWSSVPTCVRLPRLGLVVPARALLQLRSAQIDLLANSASAYDLWRSARSWTWSPALSAAGRVSGGHLNEFAAPQECFFSRHCQ